MSNDKKQRHNTLSHSDLLSKHGVERKKNTNSLLNIEDEYNQKDLDEYSPLSGSIASSPKRHESLNNNEDDNISSLANTPTLLSIKKKQKASIPLSRDEIIKIISLMCLRSSIALVFLGYFLAFQPCSTSISQYISNANDSIKLTVMFILIGLILNSFFYLLMCRKDYKNFETPYYYYRLPKCKKFEAFLTFSGLLMVMLAQSLLISRLFIKFLVEWLTPTLFAFSCLIFIAQCWLSEKNCPSKLLVSLLFLVSAGGWALVSVDALHIIPDFISHSMWADRILPIALVISLVSSIITTIEPSLKIYFGKPRNALGNADAMSDHSNSEIKEAIHPQQNSYIDDQDLETEIDEIRIYDSNELRK